MDMRQPRLLQLLVSPGGLFSCAQLPQGSGEWGTGGKTPRMRLWTHLSWKVSPGEVAEVPGVAVGSRVRLPLGTVPIAVPLGTVAVVVPLGTVPITVPLGTAPIVVPLGTVPVRSAMLLCLGVLWAAGLADEGLTGGAVPGSREERISTQNIILRL